LKIVFAILTLLIEQMMSEVMLQSLIGSQLQYGGGEQASALADNTRQAQPADMPLAMAQQLQGLTEAIDRDIKQEFGHDRQAQ
jgi:hypothetical protein